MVGQPDSAKAWAPRRRLAWLVRASIFVVPLLVAILAMVVAGRLITRPAHGPLVAAWFALLLTISYAATWATGKVMNRTLPLAALLDMSLTFPESAPSRLGLVQRTASVQELNRLATAPPDESTQHAAERILKLLTALATHDRFSRGHAERVRAYTDLIAEAMDLPAAERERLRWAALLHDIGKLQVPGKLLNKPGKPNAAEWRMLKAHPVQGSIIAAPLLGWLKPMDRVIAEHHERFDGTGYPVGLSGAAISLGARIVTVADCFEAMTAVRAYNKPMKRDAALAELVRCAGSQFDPIVVRALLAVPQRRLFWAMGPTAWLAGLPMVGQGSLGVVRAGLTHAGTAAMGVATLAVAAVSPASASARSSSTEPKPAAHAHVAVAAAGTTPTSAGSHSLAKRPRTKSPLTQPPGPTGHHSSSVVPARTPAANAKPTTSGPRTTGRPTPKAPKPPKQTAGHPAHPSHPSPAGSPGTKPAPALVTPTTTPSLTPTPGSAGICSATYTATGPANALAGVVTVTNTGVATLSGWTVTWTYPSGNQKIQRFQGAAGHQSAHDVTASNLTANGSVLPGASTTFTFTGEGNGAKVSPSLTCKAR